MKNTVFLNAAKVNFDRKLDFSTIETLTNLTIHDSSTDSEILGRVKNQNILITKEMPVGKDLIFQLPETVELICEAGTGYNNIDIAAAREKNITVCNVPGYSTEAVAQLAITSILNLSSSIVQQQLMLERGNFDNFTKYLQVPHHEVKNKILGIIGGGTIGQQTLKIALALGMQILVYDRSPKAWDNPSIQAVSLEELLKQSDFVSLHCPLTPETKHLINIDRLKLMKPTAFIINTSRGPIIKESDIIVALQNGIIAGAALDVQEQEPPALDNPLFTMDNVILTPHIGWQTLESRQRLIGLMAKNIEAFLAGRPINTVN